jgi:hypothetical protein
LKGFNSSKDGIYLECKTPSIWFLIIFIKNIYIFSTKILPFWHRFLYPFCLWKFVSEDCEKSWFSTSNVTLYCIIIIKCLFMVDLLLKLERIKFWC